MADLPTVIDVARDVVRQVNSAQLEEFDFVAERYAESPKAAEKAFLPTGESTASMIDLGGQVLGVIAMGVTTDICKDLIKGTARDGWARLLRRRRRERIDLHQAVPPLTDEKAADLRRYVAATVLAKSGDSAMAEAIADAVVKTWPRSSG